MLLTSLRIGQSLLVFELLLSEEMNHEYLNRDEMI